MTLSNELKYYILCYVKNQRRCTKRQLENYLKQKTPKFIKSEIQASNTFYKQIKGLEKKDLLKKIQKKKNCLIYLEVTQKGRTHIKYLKRVYKIMNNEEDIIKWIFNQAKL